MLVFFFFFKQIMQKSSKYTEKITRFIRIIHLKKKKKTQKMY